MKKIVALLLVLATMFLVSCGSESADIEDVLNELNSVGNETPDSSSSDTSSQSNTANSMKLTFLGDCLVSTYKGGESKGTFNWYAKNYPATYFFEKVYDTLSADDYTIANCETVLTDRTLTPRDKGTGSRVFWFYGPSANAKIFTAGSVEVTGVVNNHMKDYGQAGYEDTLAALKKENLIIGDYNKPVYLEKNGIKAAIMFVNLWSLGDANKIIADMKKLDADTDYKIIYFHGGVEGTNYPEQWKVNACRKLIDSGANFVIGMHPHVLQPIEEYHGGVIVYSLGNFLFGGNTAPVKNTIIYQIELKKGSYSQNVIPCQVYSGSRNNWQPCYPETESSRQKTLDLLVMTDKRYSGSPSSNTSSDASSNTSSTTSNDVSSNTSSDASSETPDNSSSTPSETPSTTPSETPSTTPSETPSTTPSETPPPTNSESTEE
ncbi:MAG: CapA family protein [Clostridia bacterium]|nr:CapA family protein [Clostridia bacterium]